MTDTATNPQIIITPPQEDTDEPSIQQANAFLSAFNAELIPETDPTPDPDPDPAPSPETRLSLERAREAYWDADWTAVQSEYANPDATAQSRAEICAMMLTETGGQTALLDNPDFTARLLSDATAEVLENSDFFRDMGRQTENIALRALDNLLNKAGLDPSATDIDRGKTRDPKVFALIAGKIDTDTWNDSHRGLGQPNRGLGARTCANLWNQSGFDEIASLIDIGVDTTMAAQAQRGEARTYSGFVLPLQHIIQEHLPDIAKLGTPEASGWDAIKTNRIQGAQRVFEALERSGSASTLTRWEDVQSSELIAEFKANPGTIWGFENIRGPYVLAAHETDQGAQPVRMMEIWEAVEEALQPADYAELIENPNTKIPEVILKGVRKIEEQFAKDAKYAPVQDKKDAYIKEFVLAADGFLRSFASEIPRGTFARVAKDTEGQVLPKQSNWDPDVPIAVSDITGVHNSKFMGGIACKAGLWAAKEQGKPVYYCLDGINMDDVTSYKIVKNKAIEKFLQDGGVMNSHDPHKEVITMQEVREVLKNWDDLKGTVKLCVKGKIMQGPELEEKVRHWQEQMEAADQIAGRAPAPSRTQLTAEMNSIDSKLIGRLNKEARRSGNEAEVDMDARDVVRKSGYLLKIAKANPDAVLKYLMSKCDLLFKYELLSRDLAGVAAQLVQMAMQDPAVTREDLDPVARRLVQQLNQCSKNFRKPLAAALVRHPMLAHTRKLQKLGK